MIGRSSLMGLAVLGIVAFSSIGCDSDNDHYDHHDATVRTDRDYSDMRLPDRADRMTTGRDSEFSWRADRPGTVYVYDADTSRVLYSRHIRTDDKVTVDVPRSQVLVNNDTVLDRNLKRGDRYEIYFDRDRDNG